MQQIEKVNYLVVDFLRKLQEKTYNKFPTNEDLHGALDALLRLQDLYKLSADQIARGELYHDVEQPVSMKCKIDITCFTFRTLLTIAYNHPLLSLF